MERSLRKEVSQESRVPETPKDKCRRCNKISWSTVSNAALTLKRAKSVSWQWSTAPRTSENRRRRRVSVEWPFSESLEGGYCIVLYLSIYIVPLNSHGQTEALLVQLVLRKETSFKK